MKTALAQGAGDAGLQGTANDKPQTAGDITSFDLSHLDRIPKSQLRAVHHVHENFVRSLAASLSAYLRTSVGLNLVSLEQISYSEFLDGLSFPTCLAYIGMLPYEGTAVLEMNTTLMFTLVELLMGSKGRKTLAVQRKLTDIEKSIMQTVLRVILRDLAEAWNSVAKIDFAVTSLASEPQTKGVLKPGEAVIVIAVDVRIGSVSGLMNLAIPSIFVKRLRHKFDQPQTPPKGRVNEPDPVRISKLIQDVTLSFTTMLDAGCITARELLDLEAGDVVVFDVPIDRPVKGIINDRDKWTGSLAESNNKLFFEAAERVEAKP